MTNLRESEDARRTADPSCAPCGPGLTLDGQSQENEKASDTAKCELQITPQNQLLMASALIKGLSILDRFLALLVLIAMILGVVIGVYAPGAQAAFSGAEFAHTSVRECSPKSSAIDLAKG